jgi:hypothetical protein
MKRLGLVWVAAVPLAAALGCSIINSFDDVKPATDGGADSGIGEDVLVDTSSEETADTGSPDDTGPMTDGGTDLGADTAPVDKGLIVVGTAAKNDAGVTENFAAVLDPENGHRLGTDEKVTAAIIRYDGARDLWYFFENASPSYNISPTHDITLTVRRWKPDTNTWVKLGTLPHVPPPLADETTAVLANRLAYVSQTNDDAGVTGYALTGIDTSDSSAPKLITPSVAITDPPLGVIGTRASPAGGTLNMVFVENCVGSTCDVTIQRAQYPTAAAAPTLSATHKKVGTSTTLATGTPSYASFLNAGSPNDVIVLPPVGGGKDTLIRLQPASSDPVLGTSPISFGPSNTNLRPMAIAECQSTALVVDLLGVTLFAVPLSNDTGAMSTSVGLTHPGQRVYFEPYTNTAIAPFKQGITVDIAAYTLGGTAKAPTLAKRPTSSWSTPMDLQPNSFAVKQPVEFVCK